MSTKKALPPPINKGIIWKMKTVDKGDTFKFEFQSHFTLYEVRK